MAASELVIKYSNDMYATKKQVSDAMRTPLIDNIWNNIVEYRSNFSTVLSLKHITGTKFNICFTPAISSRINNIERKMSKLVLAYNKLKATGSDYTFKQIQYNSILKELALKYNINVEDTLIKGMIDNNLSVLPPETMILKSYLKCLNEIETNYLKEIDDVCLGDYYSYLTGSDELNEFYRTTEVDNQYSKYVINKLYIGVPVNAIEKGMDELFDFINNSNTSLFVKAAATLYYIYYIKPFEFYSEEISLLLFKKVLANNDLEDVASLINFEVLLNKKEEFETWLLETQKTFDLTYFISYLIKVCDAQIDEALNNVAISQNTVIKKEFYAKEENLPVTNEFKEVLKEDISSNEIQKEAVNHSEIESNNHQTTSFSPLENHKEDTINYTQVIAISNVPSGLSEEDAKRLEIHLLEMNPNLSRSQAYFYARHCTLGMSYTISQFKKEVGCAYETARTSMDNLVVLGYYRKEMLRNKFIYTPVKKN